MDERLGESEPLPSALLQQTGLLVATRCGAKPLDDPLDGAGMGLSGVSVVICSSCWNLGPVIGSGLWNSLIPREDGYCE